MAESPVVLELLLPTRLAATSACGGLLCMQRASPSASPAPVLLVLGCSHASPVSPNPPLTDNTEAAHTLESEDAACAEDSSKGDGADGREADANGAFSNAMVTARMNWYAALPGCGRKNRSQSSGSAATISEEDGFEAVGAPRAGAKILSWQDYCAQFL